MKLDYEINGNGDVAVIVESALGSTYAEWRPIVKSLSDKCTVLLYDRAGYGKSAESELERSPKQIAKQLHELVSEIIPNKKYILIGHSLGGLCMQQYARDYSTDVIGAVFLDPTTTEEYRFKIELCRQVYRKSGIDKTKLIKQGLLLGRLRLLKLFKPLLKKSIPFYYYKNYDVETEKDILNHLTQLKTYKTSLREYRFFEKQQELYPDLHEHPFPPIPVRVLMHNPKIVIDEIGSFGGLSVEDCTKIDALWREIMDNHYSKLTADYRAEIAVNSGHYIHLTDKELLVNKINEIITAHTN